MRLSLTLALLLAATPLAADPVEGLWQTAKDDNGNYGYIQVTMCAQTVCGKLVRSFNEAGQEISSPNIGKMIVWDMQPLGGGQYGRGKIWSPDRDKTYDSKMTLSGDELAVKGCILIICRDGGHWQRVK